MNWSCCETCGRPLTPAMAADLTAYVSRSLDNRPIRVLRRYPFGPGTLTRIAEAGHETIGDLVRAGESLLNIRGIGPKTFELIESAIDDEIAGEAHFWTFTGGDESE